MNFLVSFNDVKPILYTFFGTIGLLIVFMGVAYLAKFLSDKMHNKKTDINYIKSEVYRLIYENSKMSLEDLVRYLDVKEEVIETAIKDLIDSNQIIFNDKKYQIKAVAESIKDKKNETTENKNESEE